MLLKDLLPKELLDIPLLVKGYSNFKIYPDKKELLLKAGLEDIETKNLYSTQYFQPEFLNLFPLRSVIHQGKIVKFEGNIKEIEINFNETKYKKIKNIENPNIIKLINNLFYFNENSCFAKYHNIIVPSHVIGQYFYFPNTNVRRLFRKEHIDALAYEVDCKKGHIIFKRNIKNENITAIFAYLFECNKYFSDAFTASYTIHIKNPLEKELQYSNICFQFPKMDKKLKLTVRGEQFDNIFVVYEILNFDFRQVIDLEKLEVSYIGNKKIPNSRTLKTNVIASKIPANKSNISHLEGYSKEYEETIFESSEFVINKENQIKVEKVSPKKFNETFSSNKVIREKADNKGITFSNFEDNKSDFGRGNVGIGKSDICSTLKEFIEKNFNISFYDCKNLENYAYFHFALIFKDNSHREYLITKLNIPNSATYVFSSPKPIYFFKYIPNELFKILSEGKGEYADSLDGYSRYLIENWGICFHTSLKKKENETIDNWLERLKEKIKNYTECKGTNR